MRAKHRLVPAVRLQDPTLLNDPNYNSRRLRVAVGAVVGTLALGGVAYYDSLHPQVEQHPTYQVPPIPSELNVNQLAPVDTSEVATDVSRHMSRGE